MSAIFDAAAAAVDWSCNSWSFASHHVDYGLPYDMMQFDVETVMYTSRDGLRLLLQMKLSVRFASSVFIWQHCDAICISGFVDNVMCP